MGNLTVRVTGELPQSNGNRCFSFTVSYGDLLCDLGSNRQVNLGFPKAVCGMNDHYLDSSLLAFGQGNIHLAMKVMMALQRELHLVGVAFVIGGRIARFNNIADLRLDNFDGSACSWSEWYVRRGVTPGIVRQAYLATLGQRRLA